MSFMIGGALPRSAALLARTSGHSIRPQERRTRRDIGLCGGAADDAKSIIEENNVRFSTLNLV